MDDLTNPDSSSAQYLRAAGFVGKPAAFFVFSPGPRRERLGGKDFWKIGLNDAAFRLCLLAPERRVCGRSMRLRKDSQPVT